MDSILGKVFDLVERYASKRKESRPRPFNKFGAKSKSDFGQIFRSFRIFRLVRRLAEG